MNRSSRRLLATLRIVAAACSLAVAATTLAQDTSLAAQEKQLKDQAIGALTRKDVTTLFAVMDEYRGLVPAGAQIPAGLFFAEADAARGSGDPVRAERAFGDFFRVASPEGPTFAEAMRTYGEFRASITEATWSILDTMVPIAASSPTSLAPAPAGAGPSTPGPGLRVTPFSIGFRAVTRGQFAEFVSATGHAIPSQDLTTAADCRSVSIDVPATLPAAEPATAPVPDASPAPAQAPALDVKAPMTCVSWTDAIAFVDWLSSSTGVKFRLPTGTEWEHATRTNMLASKPGGDGAEAPPAASDVHAVTAATREWVADCAVTSGIDVAPGDATEGGGGNCKQRTLVSTRGTGTLRETRAADYRASNLGFRLAL